MAQMPLSLTNWVEFSKSKGDTKGNKPMEYGIRESSLQDTTVWQEHRNKHLNFIVSRFERGYPEGKSCKSFWDMDDVSPNSYVSPRDSHAE